MNCNTAIQTQVTLKNIKYVFDQYQKVISFGCEKIFVKKFVTFRQS